MNYQELNGITIPEGFTKFIKDNPHFYEAFEKQVLKEISEGSTYISSKNVINALRFNRNVGQTTDINFKVNDAFQSFFSRLFVDRHPQYISYFKFRKQRSQVPAPYMSVKESIITFLP